MLMQDYMFQMIEKPGYKAPFTPAQAAAHKYPLQLLCNFAYIILDEDTGNLLEYRHLIKHQNIGKHGASHLNTKSGNLPPPLRPLSSSTSTKSLRTAKVMSHMAESFVSCTKGRRTSIAQDSQWVAISSTTPVTVEFQRPIS
jgi:hypothetical protein